MGPHAADTERAPSGHRRAPAAKEGSKCVTVVKNKKETEMPADRGTIFWDHLVTLYLTLLEPYSCTKCYGKKSIRIRNQTCLVIKNY